MKLERKEMTILKVGNMYCIFGDKYVKCFPSNADVDKAIKQRFDLIECSKCGTQIDVKSLEKLLLSSIG